MQYFASKRAIEEACDADRRKSPHGISPGLLARMVIRNGRVMIEE